jgi:hypothetical protein
LHVVDEGTLAVDLDNRDPLAVGGLELGVARDVYLHERDLLRGENLPRAIAQVTALRGVEGDVTQG